jgi:hypothetical protein
MVRAIHVTIVMLRTLMRARHLVRFTRPFERGFVDGYVLDVGSQLFLVAVVSGQMRFDGFQAFRIRDVRDLQEHPFAAFWESALRKRRERRGSA